MATPRSCGNCGESGHNKRTCKNPPKAREVTPVPVTPAISYAPKKVERIKQVESQEFEGGLPMVDMPPCLLRLNGYTYICSGSFRMEVPNDTKFEEISNYVSWR